MKIPPDAWQTLSTLLDQALELPVDARNTWLDALPDQHAALKDTLRELLAQAGSMETAGFLATLPRFAPSTVARPLAEPAPGTSVGPYLLLRELGTGGMGTVWLAERADGALKRKVALKLPRMAWAGGLAERMARERDILASLEHPHIARLYDAGLDAMGRPYLALEYVEGQPIDVYSRDRALSVRRRLDLLLQVCGAVAFAHSRLVVHRDLKPSNILVTAEGQVRLLDFGIAKLLEGDTAGETQLTQLAGRALTLDYASPEQIKGEPIGTASDVYSLAVVAYELLTCARPYRLKRGSAAELEEAIAAAEPPRASSVAGEPAVRRALRGDLDAILHKALRKSPAQRYATIDAFAQDVRRHLSDEPVSAQPESVAYRTGKLLRRYRLQATAGAIVIAAILTGTVAALWQAREAARAAGQERLARETALAQARTAQAVKDFLIELFSSNDVNLRSAEARRSMSAEQLLQEGARRVNDRFRDQPALRAELQGVVGRLLYDLRLLEHAAPALQERAEYLDRIEAGTAERAAAWLAVARLRAGQADHDRVAEALQRAMAAGEKAQTPEDWLAYWAAVSEYGSFLENQGRYEEAMRHLKRAVEGLRAVAPASAEFGLASESYAGLLIDEGKAADGLPLLSEALTLYEALHKHQPVDLARVYIRYGNHLLGVDDANAERLTRRGLQLMSEYAGADHPSTARGVLRLAQLTIRRGEPQEARKMLEPLLTAIDASPKAFSSQIPTQAYRFLGEANLEEGRLAEADRWTTRYLAAAQVGIEIPLAHALMSRVRAEAGDYGSAQAHLQKAQALFAENTAADHPVFAKLRVQEAELMWRKGRSDAARETLATIVAREGETALQEAADGARIALARIALDMKEPGQALAWIGPVHERFMRLPADQRGRVREIRIVVPLANALIGMGRAKEAEPLVARAVALAEGLHGKGPMRLQVQALAIRLDAAQGRTDAARERMQN